MIRRSPKILEFGVKSGSLGHVLASREASSGGTLGSASLRRAPPFKPSQLACSESLWMF